MKYIIASRGSKLALFQAELVKRLLSEKYPEHEWIIETFTTTGDRLLNKPLHEFGGKGAFLKEIEEALLQGRAQVAVHSLKDVPSKETAGLQLAAYLAREDPRDVWVSHQEDVSHLPSGKKVGTSSLRRSVLLQFYRKDLQVEMLRGNLDTRLRKLEEGIYDAIILAAAGLHRLKFFDEKYMHYLSEDAFIPAVGQGIMVVQTRSDVPEMELVRGLNDSYSETAAGIERKFLGYFEGGCHLPIGALATKSGERWRFRGFIGGVKSHHVLQEVSEHSDPSECAPQLYESLMSQGAGKLLAELNDSK